MERYFDKTVSDEEMRRIVPGAVENSAGFNAKEVREYLQERGFLPQYVIPYLYRPFDLRWLYWEPETNLLDRKREEYFSQVFEDNIWLCAVQQNRKSFDPPVVTKRHSSRHIVERGANLFPLLLKSTARRSLFDAETIDSDTPSLNLSEPARAYLTGINEEGINLFLHVVAILHAPVYRQENSGALRQDWPRVPLPGDAEALRRSAELGRRVAALLAYDPADASTNSPLLKGVISSPLRAEMRVVGVVARAGGGQLRPTEGEYALDANWGYATPKGVMPGRGRAEERDYTEGERAAIAEGAAALGLSEAEAFARLGGQTFDVYLNEVAFWRNVPARVWGYHVGGYQVVKKWLSYREREVLGRDLSTAEVNEVRDMARRIAALLLLEPALDENYHSVKQHTYA